MQSQSVWRSVFSGRMLSVLILGFSSGLPLLLVGSTFRIWMREEGVDLTLIGLFALAGLPYTLKFLWAPVMDRYIPPFLDRRRGWILITQIALLLTLVALGYCNPASNLQVAGLFVFLVSFFSASQDIAIDAYRRDILADDELGFGSALAVNGYRLGMLLAGAGALSIAKRTGWDTAYLCMGIAMVVGMITTFLSPAVEKPVGAPPGIVDAVVMPFKEFFQRRGTRAAVEVLLFIFLFKIGDQMASDMLGPLYVDLKYDLDEIAAVSKLFGTVALISGGLIGGALMIKIGIFRSLWVFGVLQAVSTAGFALLAQVGHSIPMLAGVIAFENLSGGMGTAAYVGYMASLCDKRYTATQYALLSSFMGVPRVFLGSSSGFLAKTFGWQAYFIFCALIAIPGLLMLFRVKRWQTPETV